MQTHLKLCDYATPGPWSSEQNNDTGMLEIMAEKGPGRDKILEIKEFTDEDIELLIQARSLLPRYIKALKFLSEVYEDSRGKSDVGKETLTHVESILQGTK